ncbi:MAG: DUF4145 domain-containing protein [Thermoplasmata archaeon]|nr:MAG: DUF4145 domain-containing protein [Thermoplasmata archaeon]
MDIRVGTTDACESRLTSIVTKCPKCGNGGTFYPLQSHDLYIYVEGMGSPYTVGHRVCPNDGCKAYLFFCKHPAISLITFPSLRIDFKTENIPDRIRLSLEEAITCHAEGCYIASAIMVRRTLEELCDDKGIKGDNLKKRIEGLKSVVVLPQGLLEALDELRLLGNDAAHIESKEYDEIGEEEVSTAIEITKEILKGVYQMDTLVKKLKKLKKSKQT